ETIRGYVAPIPHLTRTRSLHFHRTLAIGSRSSDHRPRPLFSLSCLALMLTD
ncbi:unnamed protein product, partial [Musa acuminata var. zebrina]